VNVSEPPAPIEGVPSDEGDLPAGSRLHLLRNLAFMAVAGVTLYFAGPKVVDVFSKFPQLTKVAPGWLFVILACETLSFVMVWQMLRMVMHTKQWFPVVTAQLSGNAFSSIVPGGAPAGAALQVRMLHRAGVDTTLAATGMTVFTLLQFASLTSLPIFVLPTIIGGAAVPGGLRYSVVIGGVAFLVIIGIAALFAGTDRPVLFTGHAIQSIANRVRKNHPPIVGLPQRLLAQRNETRRLLGARWRPALVVTFARILFDYLALLTALAAVGSRPRPSLVLLAYGAAVVLALVPVTPGGLGFVEVGLTGALTLAGVSPGDAVFATLIYRLVSYWLPLLAGLVAYIAFRTRFKDRPEQATS
jgi:uncharacterized protein (TIRG00374 family)